jgi:hypothetical protein
VGRGQAARALRAKPQVLRPHTRTAHTRNTETKDKYFYPLVSAPHDTRLPSCWLLLPNWGEVKMVERL